MYCKQKFISGRIKFNYLHELIIQNDHIKLNVSRHQKGLLCE